MKFPQSFFKGKPPVSGSAADLRSIQRTIEQALESAGLGAKASAAAMPGVLELLQRQGVVGSDWATGLGGSGAAAPKAMRDDASVIDVVARKVGVPRSAEPAGPRTVPAAGRTRAGTISAKHTGAAGTRSYQVYMPASAGTARMPVVMMLHGCTQSPDDFAAGTRMNELAERDGFIVVYPAQSPNANGSKCWNWFRAQDQARAGGEPALIAGILADVAATYPVDEARVFVAGLSAGAAMAVILGETHPELFAAIGVHSGLAYGAAHDVSSAFSAMAREPFLDSRRAPTAAFVPTIVFHGDRDATVNSGNGLEVVAQALARERLARPGTPLRESIDQQTSPGGQRYTRVVHSDGDGQPLVEQWLVHGAGHAWSGGSSAGSYTDPAGPDASEAMLRFFRVQAGRQSRE